MRFYYEDGLFYQTEHDNIPAGAVEVTAEELDYFNMALADGAVLEIVDGKLTVAEPEPVRQWWDGGFYRSDIHGAMPEGVIEISEEQRHELLEAQSTGKVIMASEGAVIAVDPDTLLTESEKYERAAAQVRSQRDRLLAETDYLIMPDYPVTEAAESAVRAYRQALRDITLQEGFPFNVEWPEKPAV